VPFDYCEACTKRIALQTSVYFIGLIKQLTLFRCKQPSKWDAGNSFNKGLASCGCKASRGHEDSTPSKVLPWEATARLSDIVRVTGSIITRSQIDNVP
jgi:hypothetical protein